MQMKMHSLHSLLTFGKHKGEMVSQVIRTDPTYIDWALATIGWFDLDEEAEEALSDTLDALHEADRDYPREEDPHYTYMD